MVEPGRKILKQEPYQLPGSEKILLPGTGTETLFLVGYWFLAGSFGFRNSLVLPVYKFESLIKSLILWVKLSVLVANFLHQVVLVPSQIDRKVGGDSWNMVLHRFYRWVKRLPQISQDL